MEHYVVHVTKKCNMACRYCYESDKTSEYSWAEVSKLLEDIANTNRDKEFTIEFLGGEPLLAFELVKASVDYLEGRKDIEVPSYTITTNGTILDDDIIAFLKANPKVTFAASLDGHKTMNQLRLFKPDGKTSGANSHPVVVANLKRLIAEGINCNVHMVTHPYNVGFLHDGIKHLYDLGIRAVGVGTVEKTLPLTEEYQSKFVSELRKVSDAMLGGVMPGLYVDVLCDLKPKSDVRKYVRQGDKMLAETYGRTSGDITSTDLYATVSTSSPLGDAIYNLRKTVYEYHQNNLQRRG